jgi:hypothetical protein
MVLWGIAGAIIVAGHACKLVPGIQQWGLSGALRVPGQCEEGDYTLLVQDGKIWLSNRGSMQPFVLNLNVLSTRGKRLS